MDVLASVLLREYAAQAWPETGAQMRCRALEPEIAHAEQISTD